MRHGSLFSGIGGFDLAAEWIGFTNIFQVEIDEFCQQVLKKNFPYTVKYKDIKEFDGTTYKGTIDIITGDFPVSHSHMRVREKAVKMNEPYSPKCLGLLEKSNQSGSWQKMLVESLVSIMENISRKFVHNWRMKITKYNRLLFQHLPSKHRIDETEFGLFQNTEITEHKMLPTPTQQDSRIGTENKGGNKHRKSWKCNCSASSLLYF